MRGLILNHVGAADRRAQQDAVVVVVVGRAGADSASRGAGTGSRVGEQAERCVLLRGEFGSDCQRTAWSDAVAAAQPDDAVAHVGRFHDETLGNLALDAEAELVGARRPVLVRVGHNDRVLP